MSAPPAAPAPREPVGAAAILPTVLALAAEAAWVAVLAGLLQAFTLRPPQVAYPWFFLGATAGVLTTRALEARAGTRWPGLAAILAVGAGAAAWLAAPAAREALVGGGAGAVPDAVAANVAGWLVALAFARGIAHARLPEDPARIATMIAVGVPSLAVLAILGGAVRDPARARFLAAAQPEVVLFLVAGVLALGLARLGAVTAGGAVAWWRNRAWLTLTLALLVGAVAVSLLVSATAGPPIVMALGALLTPALIVGFIAGFERRSLLILVLAVTGTGVAATLLQLLARLGDGTRLAPGPVPPAQPAELVARSPVTIGVLGLVLALAVLALLLLARLWMRRPAASEPDVPESRIIDRGDASVDPRPRRVVRLRRAAPPRDAAAAYRALLEDIGRDEAVRRHPGETPAEHAARLRAAGRGALALELLAADYALEGYGEATLSPRETNRAIGRWRLLRRRLRRPPEPPVAHIG